MAKEMMNDALSSILTPEDIAEFKRSPLTFYAACRKIPALFVAYVLGLQMSRCHLQIQQFLSDNPDCLVKAHRGIGKTVQVSIGRTAWELGNNPNIRIKIIQNTLPEARKTVGAIRDLVDSERFRKVFPDLRPNPKKWGADAIQVKRDKAGLRDPSVEAIGVFGRAGSRADLLLYDDICDLENSVRVEANREKVKEAVSNTWTPSLYKGGRTWRVGTPYHASDIIADWTKMAELGDLPMLELKCNGTVSSPWPEEFSPERLENLRLSMGSIAYARAYELVPLSGDTSVFKEHDLDSAMRNPPPNYAFTRIATVDLAFTEKTGSIVKKKQPDFSVMLIGDVGKDGHIYVRHMVRAQTTAPKWREIMLKQIEIWRPARVYMEESGPLKGIVQDYREFFRLKGVALMTKARGKDKYTRAIEQQKVVEDGMFHLGTDDQGHVLRELKPLRDEMVEFPIGSHDDCVDCAIDMMSESRGPRPDKTAILPSELTYKDFLNRRVEQAKAASDWVSRYRDGGYEAW